MDKNLTRKCAKCGEVCVVKLKLYHLGVRFVENCKCGVHVCADPFDIKWHRYAKRDTE